MTEEEKIICKQFLNDADKTHSCNEYKLLMDLLEQEPILDKIRAEIAEYGSIMVSYAITKDTKTDKGIEKLVSGVLKEAKEQVLEIIDKYKAERSERETETWNGIHAQITVPKGTFDKIFNDTEEDIDDI